MLIKYLTKKELQLVTFIFLKDLEYCDAFYITTDSQLYQFFIFQAKYYHVI